MTAWSGLIGAAARPTEPSSGAGQFDPERVGGRHQPGPMTVGRVGVPVHDQLDAPPGRRPQPARRMLEKCRRDPVAPVRVQAREPDAAEHDDLGPRHRRVRVDRPAPVRCDHPGRHQCLVGEVQPDQIAAQQQLAMLLVERDPVPELRQLVRRRLRQVPLDAEVTEDRAGCPEVQVVLATGGMRPPGGDVRAHQLRRHQLSRPAMHQLPLEGVDAVRDPDPVGPLQHPEVDPGSAGGARLDLQPRMGGLDLVDQPVERQGLIVDAGPAARLGAGVHQVPVVVPLDVADLVLGEDREDRVPDVRVAVRDAEVDHLLVSGLDRQPVAGGHHPLRVCPRGVGVDVDHLRLEPQPELHAETGHLVHQGMQAVRPHLFRHLPVTQPGMIVAS